jgi:hypothetical protein
MKLTIQRSQEARKGMLGGHKGVEFSLYTRVSFTGEERQLLDHYGMWNYCVMQQAELPVTLANLNQGRHQTLGDVAVLLQNEDQVKEALDPIPLLLEVLRSFGGDEVIEYPRDA